MDQTLKQYLSEVRTPSKFTALTIYGYDPSNVAIEETDREDVINSTNNKPIPLPEFNALKKSMLNQAIAKFTNGIGNKMGSLSAIRSQESVQQWMDWAMTDANEMILWKMEGGTPALTAMVYQL